jgi:LmbE family N-acetylglucosaminyl deacetylase
VAEILVQLKRRAQSAIRYIPSGEHDDNTSQQEAQARISNTAARKRYQNCHPTTYPVTRFQIPGTISLMDWIYLSPHLDDVALSVGGLLWEQSQAGEHVAVWTICAGDPPPGVFSPFAQTLHARWETGAESMPIRRSEDIESCRLLGVEHLHFNIPDCIYRRSPKSGKHLYDSEESLWISVHPDEEELVHRISADMAEKLPQGARLVCPLTLGNHVDHRLTRMATERLKQPLWFYADYPYVLETINQQNLTKYQSAHFPISPQALLAWQKAVAAHRSQISTFWTDPDEMRQAIVIYSQSMDGIKLYT